MKKLLLVIILIQSFFSFAQDEKIVENRIDILEKDCLNKENISNSETCNCIIKARESWDIELNKNYNSLKNKLPESSFLILKEAQKKWIEYRDNEFDFITSYYYEVKQGTIWFAVAENSKKEIVKRRTIELKKYLDLLDY